MTDKFKKPNHPTFSVQSQYSVGPELVGGTWQGNNFNPSPDNFAYRTPNQLSQYLWTREGQAYGDYPYKAQ